MLDIAGAGEHVTKCQEEAKINKFNFHSDNSQTGGGKSARSVTSSASLDEILQTCRHTAKALVLTSSIVHLKVCRGAEGLSYFNAGIR